MQPVWVYHGHSFPFDMDDYEDSEKYRSAVNVLASAKVPERMSDPAGFIKAYCAAIGAFFNHIFGDGTAEILFGEKISKRLCDDAYSSFLEFVSRQVQESDARMIEAIRKYAPKGGDPA